MIQRSKERIRRLVFLFFLVLGIVLVFVFAFFNWMIAVAIVIFYVIAGMIRGARSSNSTRSSGPRS
jgi:hypothetical protein